MKPRFAIGNSTFSSLRAQGAHFVDKSLLIADVVQNPKQVLLLPRPRRFGKTLAMTMLRAWFDPHDEIGQPTDYTGAFSDLAVWQAGGDVRATFGQHPVILFSFKDVKSRDWSACRASIADVIGRFCGEVVADVGRAALDADESARFARLKSATASDVELHAAVLDLARWLRRGRGQQVVLLIDEYDTPITSGWAHGYYDDVIAFFRAFFSAGLKDNPHLYRGVLTGILRVAKESLFSGLNNLTVYTVLSKRCADRFGFNPAEVSQLAALCGLSDKLPGVETWYNGYTFGGQTIYNPWSVLNYLDTPEDGLKPYWANTSSDDLLRELLLRRNAISLEDWNTLLAGGKVQRLIDENLVLRGIETNEDAVWSLLLFAGYLKAGAVHDQNGETVVDLQLPNREVLSALRRMFRSQFESQVGTGGRAPALCAALLTGDAVLAEDLLGDLALAMLSYHDIAQRPAEAVYQAFVLGLMATLDATHEVTSNREAGHGRYDVLVCPRTVGEPGAVLELKVPKVRNGETAEMALDSAEAQLRQKDYAAALRERGAGSVAQWAVVFEGKRAWVRGVV